MGTAQVGTATQSYDIWRWAYLIQLSKTLCLVSGGAAVCRVSCKAGSGAASRAASWARRNPSAMPVQLNPNCPAANHRVASAHTYCCSEPTVTTLFHAFRARETSVDNPSKERNSPVTAANYRQPTYEKIRACAAGCTPQLRGCCVRAERRLDTFHHFACDPPSLQYCLQHVPSSTPAYLGRFRPMHLHFTCLAHCHGPAAAFAAVPRPVDHPRHGRG